MIYYIKKRKGEIMNIRKNNGITLIALVISIIILIILAGISISGTIRGQDETEEGVQIIELNIVQHAILERNTKAQLTKESLPGTIIEKTEVQKIIDEMNSISGENINLKGTEYKQLNKEDLEKLGIIDEENIFIVNYSTGEVINKTLKVTKSKKALYIYSKSEI